MISNTYTPIVGGVEHSINSFTAYYRKKGHRVMILTLEYDNAPSNEKEVIRLPSIRHFNGSDFSVRMPIPISLSHVLNDFEPDIVHSHHPFILGDTALRIAKSYQKPLVFTYHTRYEHYTHYVPLDIPVMKKLVIELAAGYSQLADCVIAPSLGIAKMLVKEGVDTRIEIIPTGVDVAGYAGGDGPRFRKKFKIPSDAVLLGFVGRLAVEKNLVFLTESVAKYMQEDKQSYFLLIGQGPELEKIRAVIDANDMQGRFISPGEIVGEDLIDAYHAMDAFVFASITETQGVVLMEAMAAGTPVIALRASGTEDVVEDGKNGRLVEKEDVADFVSALRSFFGLSAAERQAVKKNALKTAASFSIENMAEKALSVYRSLLDEKSTKHDIESSRWARTIGRWKAEWELIVNMADAVGEVIKEKNR